MGGSISLDRGRCFMSRFIKPTTSSRKGGAAHIKVLQIPEGPCPLLCLSGCLCAPGWPTPASPGLPAALLPSGGFPGRVRLFRPLSPGLAQCLAPRELNKCLLKELNEVLAGCLLKVSPGLVNLQVTPLLAPPPRLSPLPAARTDAQGRRKPLPTGAGGCGETEAILWVPLSPCPGRWLGHA